MAYALNLSRTTIIVVLSLSLGACQSISNDRFQKMILPCLGGAILGGVAGKLIGGNQGMAIGAATGLAVGCGIALALDEQDKQKISSAEVQALNTNKSVSDHWTNKNGENRNITVQAKKDAVDVPNYTNTVCREVDTSISMKDEKTEALPAQVYCRTEKGDWVPVDYTPPAPEQTPTKDSSAS